MSGRLAVLVGLLAGLLTAGVGLGVALLYAPQIADALYPTPSLARSATPAPSVSLRPTASLEPTPTSMPTTPGSPVAGGTASPSDSSPAGPSAAPTVSGNAPFMIGQPAPSLDLPLLGGGRIQLSELKGNAVWVNFMATWCEPCRDEFPLMSVFQARYEDEGLVVLAVDVREDAEVVRAFVDAVGGVFRVALDEDGAAQREWGAIALPLHFWIDTEGVIRDGALGGLGPDAMVEALQKILPGVEVSAP